MTRIELRILAAVIETLIGAKPREGAAEAAIKLISRLAAADRRLLSLLLFGLEYGAPFMTGRLHRFTQLNADARESYLLRWSNSRIAAQRQGVAALKALAMLAHYGGDAAWAEIGYDGPWLGRVDVPVLPPPYLEGSDAHENARTPLRTSTRQPAGISLGRHVAADLHLRVQACVVGTGAGGAAALARLAARGVEAVGVELGGHPTATDFNQRELDMLAVLYRESGLRTTADKAIGILQGTGVGGSTLHNTGLVYPTPPGIIARWRDEHGFELTETELRGRMASAISALESRPIPLELINANNDVIRRGAAALGWRYRVADHNRRECSGCGYCMLGCAYNRKVNATFAFLPAAIAGGAQVLADCAALRIEGRAGARRVVCGLRDADGRPTGRRAVIEAEVVLVAAGALDTPALLLRSGVGSRRVGQGLRLHPAPVVTGIFPEPVVAWRGLPQSVIVEEFASFMENGRGGFLLIPSASNWPGMSAAVVPGLGSAHHGSMRDYACMGSAAVLLHDETEGRVTIGRSGRPVARYWPNDHDFAELRHGIEALARIHLAAGAERVLLPHSDGPEIRTPAQLRDAMQRMRPVPHRVSLNSVHPQGSCPLGDDPARSAVNPRGELWGEAGIFVCDTSIFPTSVGVPPQVTTMALGAYVADCAADRLADLTSS